MKTTKEIQEQLSSKFPNLQLLENYKGANQKILIKCLDCGHEWKVIPRSVIASKHGCPKCGVLKAKRNIAMNKFLQKLDTSKWEFIEYKDYTNVIVKCKECGHIRNTTADNILRFGCKVCAAIKTNESRKLTTEKFIDRAKQVHGDRYDYSLVNYINYETPVKIICKKHGEFLQSPNKHLSGHNCPHCKESYGEEIIRLALLEHKIPFIQEKPIKELINTERPIKVDFYINYNDTISIIEINGEQHYFPVEYFGGQLQYNKQITRDKKLQEYCDNNNINLYIIKYDDNKLEKIQDIIKEITAPSLSNYSRVSGKNGEV